MTEHNHAYRQLGEALLAANKAGQDYLDGRAVTIRLTGPLTFGGNNTDWSWLAALDVSPFSEHGPTAEAALLALAAKIEARQ